MTLILEDILALGHYVPFAFSVTCFFDGILLILKSATKSKWSVRVFLCYMLFLFYLIMILQITYLSREAGSSSGIYLVPFSTWGETTRSHSYMIENILLFIPFGLLIPCIWRTMRSLRSFFLSPFIFSILLEVMQLITGRGYCRLDDVITNSLGGLIGFFVFKGLCQS